MKGNMIDSIKFYEIVDEVSERTDIVHPAVKAAYNFDSWSLLASFVHRESASLLLTMKWKSMSRIRYKWFRRVVDILNKRGEGCNLIFVAEPESFECEFEGRGNGIGGGISGSLHISVYERNADSEPSVQEFNEDPGDWEKAVMG